MSKKLVYEHIQTQESAVWEIQHDLQHFPSIDVNIRTNEGSYARGDAVQKILPAAIKASSANSVTIEFSQPVSGIARLVGRGVFPQWESRPYVPGGGGGNPGGSPVYSIGDGDPYTLGEFQMLVARDTSDDAGTVDWEIILGAFDGTEGAFMVTEGINFWDISSWESTGALYIPDLPAEYEIPLVYADLVTDVTNGGITSLSSYVKGQNSRYGSYDSILVFSPYQPTEVTSFFIDAEFAMGPYGQTPNVGLVVYTDEDDGNGGKVTYNLVADGLRVHGTQLNGLARDTWRFDLPGPKPILGFAITGQSTSVPVDLPTWIYGIYFDTYTTATSGTLNFDVRQSITRLNGRVQNSTENIGSQNVLIQISNPQPVGSIDQNAELLAYSLPRQAGYVLNYFDYPEGVTFELSPQAYIGPTPYFDYNLTSADSRVILLDGNSTFRPLNDISNFNTTFTRPVTGLANSLSAQRALVTGTFNDVVEEGPFSNLSRIGVGGSLFEFTGLYQIRQVYVVVNTADPMTYHQFRFFDENGDVIPYTIQTYVEDENDGPGYFVRRYVGLIYFESDRLVSAYAVARNTAYTNEAGVNWRDSIEPAFTASRPNSGTTILTNYFDEFYPVVAGVQATPVDATLEITTPLYTTYDGPLSFNITIPVPAAPV